MEEIISILNQDLNELKSTLEAVGFIGNDKKTNVITSGIEGGLEN